ncbi:MAG: periplasmic solute binding protein [Anaerocolumna sp.]|nr:periplasmic solute binding protein [Anaerocolumna sp.]
MKKKLFILLGIMLVLILGSTIVAAITGKEAKEKDKLTIVTSFYPMYLLAQNITDGAKVEVINLTEYEIGCLHDYQLTTLDMQKLEAADVFIMNGGGMESFADDILNAYPDLSVINASEGIEYLLTKGHDHAHEEDEEHEEDEDYVEDEEHVEDEDQTDYADHVDDAEDAEDAALEGGTEISADNESDEHEDEELENNAHVWLNMNYYLQQIQTVQDAMAKLDPENANIYQENGNQYQEKVQVLKAELESTLKGVEGEEVVIFHDAFAYLAQELGLEVIFTVNLDGDYALSAGDVAEAIDEVNLHQIKVLFTEEQYSTTIADSIAKETGATVYVIDSLVTGDLNKDAYLTAMKNNIKVLQQALGK